MFGFAECLFLQKTLQNVTFTEFLVRGICNIYFLEWLFRKITINRRQRIFCLVTTYYNDVLVYYYYNKPMLSHCGKGAYIELPGTPTVC